MLATTADFIIRLQDDPYTSLRVALAKAWPIGPP